MPRKGQTKFKPEYCEMLIEHMKQGYDFRSFGPAIGVSKMTIHTWKNRYPEFKAAYEEGLDHAFHFWERIGMAGMTGKIKNFNATVWIFTLKNRFGWRDRQDIEHSGPDGKPIETKNEIRCIVEDYRDETTKHNT